MVSETQDINTFWAYKKGTLDKKGVLVLLDNVQFIYELALAQLELQALDIDFQS
jgi:hypothetical protein